MTNSIAFNLGFDAYLAWSYSDENTPLPENPYTTETALEQERFDQWNSGWAASRAAEIEYMKYMEELELMED